uniref:DUF1330 domain-containing protein n=1 Tax=Heterorhabditis bacteriophora TaxID=37862 RepID=A0A1I7XAN1_HETBA
MDWSSTATLFSVIEADIDPAKKSFYADYIEGVVDKVVPTKYLIKQNMCSESRF